MDKIIEILIDKKPEIKRINFPLPIPYQENNINFCGSFYKEDFLKYYDISSTETNYLKVIDKVFSGGKIINEYLNNLKKKLISSNYYSLDDLWDYITILNYSRKIFLNNNSNFQYTQNDEIISSSSLDFEYCMSLYIMASKQQLLLLDNDSIKLKDSKQLKEKVSHLIISEKCFDEAFLIAKTIDNNNNNNIIIVSSQEEENEEKIEPFKIFSNNPKRYIINLDTQSMGNEDVNNILIKSNTSILSKWVNDIGGLDLMKTRSKIAYCQANEYYFKSLKYLILQNNDVPKTVLSSNAYAIGLSYQSIFNNNNGPLNNEKYDENFNKIFSKFMSKYWFFKSHYITFINNTEQFIKGEEDYDLQDFIENSIDIEYSRFKKIKKYQNVLIKLNNNNNFFNTFIQKINKNIESIELIFKNFNTKIAELSLPIDENFKLPKNTMTPLYCLNISKTIQFNDFINNSFKRIINKKNRDFQFFLNFTDNKIINLNDISPKLESIINSTNQGFNGNLLLKFRDYQEKWIEHEKKTLINHYDREIFLKGKIHERLSWIHFLIGLLKNNNTFTDENNSIKYIENTIQEFINNIDQFQ